MKSFPQILLTLIFLLTITHINAQQTNTPNPDNGMLTAYLKVKNALAADDTQLAKLEAKGLSTAIHTIPSNYFAADQQVLWKKYKANLSASSTQLSDAQEIEAQRTYFANISSLMYILVKGLKNNTTILYEQYCPMKKATWLSETADIKNPCFGRQMLTCGQSKETLSPLTK